MALKLVFMGTPDFSVPALEAIAYRRARCGRRLFAAAAAAGPRHGREEAPVHAFAESKGLQVRTPLSLKSEAEQQAFAALAPTPPSSSLMG